MLNLPPAPNIIEGATIDSSTQLNLFVGGSIGDSVAAGVINGPPAEIEINVNGGSIGNRFDAHNGTSLRLNSGSIGDQLTAYDGSSVTIDGGEIGEFFDVRGANVLVEGGTIGNGFIARNGLRGRDSSVVIRGGMIEDFTSFDGSDVVMFGGTISNNFSVHEGGTATIGGGDFRINGVPIEGLQDVGDASPVNPPANSVLSGVLIDGSPFIINISPRSQFAEDALTLAVFAIPPVGAADLELPRDDVLHGLRSGQTLVVRNGGSTGDGFRALAGSVIEVAGGEVGGYLRSYRASVAVTDGSIGDDFFSLDSNTITLSGGSIGRRFTAGSGSVVNISGGQLGRVSKFEPGSTLNLSGGKMGDEVTFIEANVNMTGGQIDGTVNIHHGTEFSMRGGWIGDNLSFRPNSVATIYDGTVGDDMSVMRGAKLTVFNGTIGDGLTILGGTVDLYGGTIGDEIAVYTAQHGDDDVPGHLNLFGTDFWLNEESITASLSLNVLFEIADHNVDLNGQLADGSLIELNLTSDSINDDSVATVTLVETGDFNDDRVVDVVDLAAWEMAFGSEAETPYSSADGNGDQRISGDDLLVWQRRFGRDHQIQNTARVPEPPTLALLLAAAFVISRMGVANSRGG